LTTTQCCTGSHKDADVCDAFISSLIDLRVRVQENFANNLLHSSQERLARALPSIAHLHKDDQAWPKVTRQELANMIGVTRQRVDVVLKRFRESGGHSLRGSSRDRRASQENSTA
jgi:CRP-like cAMP-binding protein